MPVFFTGENATLVVGSGMHIAIQFGLAEISRIVEPFIISHSRLQKWSDHLLFSWNFTVNFIINTASLFFFTFPHNKESLTNLHSSMSSKATSTNTFTVTGLASVAAIESQPGRSAVRTWTAMDGKLVKNGDHHLIMTDMGNNLYYPTSKPDCSADVHSVAANRTCQASWFSAKNAVFGRDTEQAAKRVLGKGDPGQTILISIRFHKDRFSKITPMAKIECADTNSETPCDTFEEAGEVKHGVCHLAEYEFEEVPPSEYECQNKTTPLSNIIRFGDELVNR
jgi:hypothetical protein